MNARDTHVSELVWTVAGASAGGLARYWVDQVSRGTGHELVAALLLTAAAAMFIGFALVASIRLSTKTVLIAAGGAAASISAVVTRAASATPAQSVISLAAFFLCAVAGVFLGMLVAFVPLRNARERR